MALVIRECCLISGCSWLYLCGPRTSPWSISRDTISCLIGAARASHMLTMSAGISGQCAMLHEIDSVKVLARRFPSIIRFKCQQYRQRQTSILIAAPSLQQPQVFLQKLDAHDITLPASLSTHSAWTVFHQSLCGPPAARIQPAHLQPHASQPPSPCGCCKILPHDLG